MRKYEISINNKAFSVDVKEFNQDTAVLEVNGKSYSVEINDIISSQSKAAPKRTAARRAAPAAAAPAPAAASGGAGAVVAPIPGSIMEVFVKEGDAVKAGQNVVKMEAMKMENMITASSDGTVTTVKVAAGDSVNQGAELLVIG